MALALDWAFWRLGLRRVELTTTGDNAATIALARHLGFRDEGLLRRRDIERGRAVDIAWFGLLAGEWAVRAWRPRG